MKAYSVGEEALLKVLLHAAKHPTSAVNGLLLGTCDEGAVRVTDAVPVCHSFVTLTPIIEAAMSQVEHHCKAAGGGLRLVGYYQANERLGDAELGAVGRRVADRVDAACPGSVAAVLDSTALQAALQQQQDGGASAADGQPLLQLWWKDGARGWGKVPAASAQCPSTKGAAAQLTQLAGAGRHQGLADFEEHLDDISRDWLNPTLLKGPA